LLEFFNKIGRIFVTILSHFTVVSDCPFSPICNQCITNWRALAMVLWYHPRLISERSPVRFPAGCTKTFLSPLQLSPHRLKSYFDVWRHLPSAKIRIAQNNIARVHIAPKKTTCSCRPRGGRRRNHNSLLERGG
jgi:hypothetical protein